MIKENELRIGNYYIDSGDSIMWLGNGDFYLALYKKIDLVTSLNPIPITEQWLLDFGFERFGKLSNLFGRDDFWAVRLRREGYLYCSQTETSIEYVHQLQNLYSAITNKELTLNK